MTTLSFNRESFAKRVDNFIIFFHSAEVLETSQEINTIVFYFSINVSLEINALNSVDCCRITFDLSQAGLGRQSLGFLGQHLLR